MTDELSFVAEIRRSPQDLTPRLIYADYLEDNGDPRGELIRVQCELQDLQPGAPGRAELFNRERTLLEKHGEQWLQPLRALGVQGISIHSFHCGLLEHVRMDVADFLQHAETLCETAPAVCRLQLRHLTTSGSLAGLTIPQQITSLDLSSNDITMDWWRQHDDFLSGTQMTEVDLRGNRLGESDAMISLSSVWPNLESLCLGDNRFWRLNLVPNLHLPDSLRRLDVHRNPLDDIGLEYLFSMQVGTRVSHLNLSACQLFSLSRFGAPDMFPRLQELIVRNNRLSQSSWDSLSAQQREWLSNLRVLDTRNNPGALPSHGI